MRPSTGGKSQLGVVPEFNNQVKAYDIAGELSDEALDRNNGELAIRATIPWNCFIGYSCK